MKIQLPDNVRKIIRILNENGYEAYAVGGCVRDSIIGRTPGDWDITTSALPDEVKSLFKRTIDTGIEHGTVTVMLDREGYEVTTYRIDGEYRDGRHPESVEFTRSLGEDLKRRDFTINAMAYNDETGLVDMYDGMGDIERKIIRCVGDPMERFSEDALRMLRAVRFSARLGYEIDKPTEDAIRKSAGTMARVSRERIHVELGKILESDNPDYIGKAAGLGILSDVFKLQECVSDMAEALSLIKLLPPDVPMRYAGLLYQAGAGMTKKMLRELKLDNNTTDTASGIVALHGMELTEKAGQIRKQAAAAGRKLYGRTLVFEKYYYRNKGEGGLERMADNMIKLYERILEAGDPLTVRELAVTGSDLLEAGMKPGKEMGTVLNAMLADVLENPGHNSKKYLFENHLHI